MTKLPKPITWAIFSLANVDFRAYKNRAAQHEQARHTGNQKGNDMTSTAIIPSEPAEIQLLFQNGGAAIDPLIERIEAAVRSHVSDLTTKKGRDAIASLAFKVSKSKTALDTAGKALTERQKSEIKVVDDARKKIRDRLDALRDEARKPLTDWEHAEEEKKARTEQAMKDLRSHGMNGMESPAEISAAAQFIKAISLDEIDGSALDMANEAREHTLKELRDMYAAAVQREQDAAELVALREASAARDEADRLAQVERDRVEAERVASEMAATAERDRVEAERKAEVERIAMAAQEEDQAKEAEAARLVAIEADKLAAVEAARAEAQRQHEKERQADIDRIKAEADRAEKERQKAADDLAAREADISHRADVHAAITSALAAMAGNASPAQIASALMEGKIPHTKVSL
jgi:vacuolar-type H+-ATPase subunit I/STV1